MNGSLKARKRSEQPSQAGTDLSSSPSGAPTADGRVLFGVGLTKGVSANAGLAHAKASAAQALALTLDHGLIAAGIAAAVGSASFAGFMMASDNSHPMFGGIEHLMIFAQPIGGHRPPQLEPPEKQPFDYRATGSIETRPLSSAGGGEPPRSDAKAGPPRGPLAGYVLRFAHKGAVVVEGPRGSYAAVPGVVLPNAGRILSIQNRNGRWLVVTENGTIGEAEF